MSNQEKMKSQADKIKDYVKVFESNNFKCNTVYDHGFNVVVNDFQDIFIRPFDSKSYASLSPNSTKFKDIYLKDEMKRKEIGFKADKGPVDLFNDINKRLIKSSFCIDQFNYLKESFDYHNEYQNKKNNIKKEIEKIKLDLRSDESREKFHIYLKVGYGEIKYSSDSISIDLKSLNADQGYRILKFIESLENEK